VLRGCKVLCNLHKSDAVAVGEVVQKFELLNFLLIGLIVVPELLYSLPGHVLAVKRGCVLCSGLETLLVYHNLGY